MTQNYNKTLWWQRGIVYQIYPRSYQDSNGDGIGDLPGIIQRLDYLQWLGVDAIWISPVYPSPMADFGYDVSDYTDIDPMFGRLADMADLIEAAHSRQIKVILDYVPNHTSDQHPWFLESRSSRDNPKRDWYIWRDPAPAGGPPNNWLSRFDGKSAWQWDDHTEQYYLHLFLPQQPDLNWRNPDTRDAMLEVMRFWFDRGVDGLRVDVAYRVMKDPQLRDNPLNPNWQEGLDPSFKLTEIYTKNTPDIHLFGRWLREVADEYDQKVLIGEMNLPLSELVTYYGQNDEFHLPFNFRLIFTPWEAANVRALADEYDRLLPVGAWPNWVLSNHDQPRFATRAGIEQAPNGLLFLLTIPGTPTIYYGEEIGLQNVPIPANKVQDPWEKNVPGLGLGRDPERTPMQWDATPHAGFCPLGIDPWLPVAEDYGLDNVAVQQTDPRSILSFTQALIQLRRATPTLITGDYQSVDTPVGLLAYWRQDEATRLLIGLNFTDLSINWTLPPEVSSASILLSTYMDRQDQTVSGEVTLRANEGMILRLP